MPQTRALLTAITASAMLWRYSHVSSTFFARLYPAFLFWLLYPTSPHAHAPISRWHLVSVFRHLLARLVKCAVNHLRTNLRGTLSRHQPSFLFFRSFPTRISDHPWSVFRSSLRVPGHPLSRRERIASWNIGPPLGKSTIGKFTRKQALTSSCIFREETLVGGFVCNHSFGSKDDLRFAAC